MKVSEITVQEMIYAVESAEMMMLCDETIHVENVQNERWVPPAHCGYVHALFLSKRCLDLRTMKLRISPNISMSDGLDNRRTIVIG